MRLLHLIMLLCTSFVVRAAEQHSHEDHGAHDLGNIGTAHLDTSCNAAAQQEIDRGVALIHSFWYAEAEKSFRRAAAADARCGMAWWGAAMSNLHPLWAPPTPEELRTGREAAAKARQVGASTPRERGFIDAINAFYSDSDKSPHSERMAAYEKAMAGVANAHPQDQEAAIFHALALLGIASPNDKTYANQKKAAEILNRILPQQPEHPGIAHYLIHSFDYPELAALALPAARVYAKLAPGSPHALHMPSHIFTRLGLWDESIASNLDVRGQSASLHRWRHAWRRGSSTNCTPSTISCTPTSSRAKSKKRAQLVERTASVSRMDNANNFAGAFAIAAVPARFALERQDWRAAAALTVPSVIDWQKVPYAEANTHFARGVGAARAGELPIARDAIARLAAIRQMLLDQKNSYWAGQVEIQRLAVAAWVAKASNDSAEALKLMRTAADLEAATEKHPVTPGAILPAREQLAEMLLDAGRREDALAEIEHVLRDSPHRRNAVNLAERARGNTRAQATK